MALDPNIYSQLNPNVGIGMGDLVNKFVNQSQSDAITRNKLAEMAQQSQMQDIQLQQAKQQQADVQATRQALSQSGGNVQQAVPQIMQSGAYQQAMSLLKANRDMQSQNMDLAQKRMDSIHGVMGQIATSDPTKANDIINNAVTMGALHPEDAANMQKDLSGLPPDQIPAYAQQKAITAKDYSAKLAEQLYSNKNPEKFVDDQGNAWMVGANKQITPYINPKTGQQMKALPPASVQINTSNLSPDNIESNAQLIAQGKAPILTGRAALTSAGAATMKRALELNPDLTGTTYGATKSTENAFSSGKLGSTVRSFNVSLSHLDTLSNLADALDNKDTRMVNQLGNTYALQTGNPAPTNFNAAKKIVADEIVKAIVGSGGGVADREEAAKNIDAASSPAQLKGVIATYQDLMAGQLHGLKQQYTSSGGTEENWNKKLTPLAVKHLQAIDARLQMQPADSGQIPPDIQDLLKQYGK